LHQTRNNRWIKHLLNISNGPEMFI